MVEVKGSAEVEVVEPGLTASWPSTWSTPPVPTRPSRSSTRSLPSGRWTSQSGRNPNQPESRLNRPGRRLAFDYAAGEARVTIPSVDIHDIVVVEELSK